VAPFRQEGVEKVIQILKSEAYTCMQLMGYHNIKEIKADMLHIK
jgi:isopentenyl diphosphate isomerase/L-lactate dehydrogenase-like FMN-dependent dehydrogenase